MLWRPASLLLLPKNLPCESLDNLAKARILDQRSSFPGAYPFGRALMLLRPVMKLGPDLKNEYVDKARRTRTIRKPLLVAVLPAWAFADTTNHSALLHGFVCSCFIGLHPWHRPALWNDPPPAFSRCDQHDFDAAIRSTIRQCCVLRVLQPIRHLRRRPLSGCRIDRDLRC
jgi:hypothetical protein